MFKSIVLRNRQLLSVTGRIAFKRLFCCMCFTVLYFGHVSVIFHLW